MTITLDLRPEAEASLLAQAKDRGLPLKEFLQTIIANQAFSAQRMRPVEGLPGGDEELDRAIDDVFDMIQLPPGTGRVRCTAATGIDDCGRYQHSGRAIQRCNPTFRTASRCAVKALYRQREVLVCFPQNLVEFWNASTSLPRQTDSALPQNKAARYIDRRVCAIQGRGDVCPRCEPTSDV
jgi:hypothetical protein